MKLRFSLLAALLATGASAQTVDSTFGVNGYVPCTVTLGIITANHGQANCIAVQPDGGIVTAVSLSDPNNTNLFYHTYRYNSDGTPDAAFGTDGDGDSKLFVGSNSENNDLTVLPDGKILTIGRSEYCINGVCGAYNFVLMRLKPNGDRDSSFADNGLMRTDNVFGSVGYHSSPVKVKVSPAGKYVIAGQGVTGDAFIGQVTTAGIMDGSFGVNGLSTAPLSGVLTDMALDNAGNIYALLEAYTTAPGDWGDNKIIKLHADGTPDNSFGNGGVVIINQSNYDKPSALALRSDGKIVFTGTGCTSTNFNAYGDSSLGFMYILDADGSINQMTPAGGFTFHIPGDSVSFLNTLTMLPGDQMLVGGHVSTTIAGNYHQKGLLMRLNADGTPDISFNGNGTMILDYGIHSAIGSLCDLNSIVVLSNGDILVAGSRNPIEHSVQRSIFLLKLKDVPSPTSIAASGQPLRGRIYPNPWSSMLQLDYSLEQPDRVTVALYDLQGREVHCFLKEAGQPAGQHTESLLRPLGLTSGQYLLRIATRSGKSAQYPVLIRE